LEERCKAGEGDEEYVSSYWMILRKRDNTGSWKRKKHQISLSGILDLEEAMGLS